VPDTWEVVISTKGSTKEHWESIAPKMPYMATLRNLRNFLEKGVDMQPILKKISDKKLIAESKQLPFRYLSAYKEIEQVANKSTAITLSVIELALEDSIANLPKLNGVSFIAADNSGSMNDPISEHSKVHRKDIANILLAISNKVCEQPITSIFGERFKVKNFSPNGTAIANAQKIQDDEVGGSTNAWLAIKYLTDKKLFVDRIILVSDMQCYDDVGWPAEHSVKEQLDEYRKVVNPNVYYYAIDLAGYGTAQTPPHDPKTALLAGWSERVLEFIPWYETEKEGAVKKIEQLQVGNNSTLK
jgi:hypothetical protein